MPHITLLALPNALASSIALPMEMLTAADNLVRTHLYQGKTAAASSLHCHVVATEKEREITTATGLTLRLSGHALDIAATDLLIIPALWRNPLITLRRHTQLLPWLQQLARNDTHICAVGTGSFLLAEAGLLTHKPATTHWFYFDQFARRYPQIQLQRHHLITEAGNIFCAGSVNSVADLTIHFIELYYGAQIARKVEAQFSPEIRRSFESHVYTEGGADLHGDELIAQAQDILRSRYAEPVNIEELAHQLGISARSFNRRFRNATGINPNLYLQQQRLNTARELLRTSNLSITEVANAVGYSDSDYFSRRFRNAMKQTPSSYRASVRGKLFSVTRQS